MRKISNLVARIRCKIITSFVLFFLVDSMASAADTANTLTGLRTNVGGVMKTGVEMLSDIGSVLGFILFFMGVYGIYNSHVNKQSGGKPMGNNVTMIAVGAILISAPLLFKQMTAVMGGSGHKVGGGVTAAGMFAS